MPPSALPVRTAAAAVRTPAGGTSRRVSGAGDWWPLAVAAAAAAAVADAPAGRRGTAAPRTTGRGTAGAFARRRGDGQDVPRMAKRVRTVRAARGRRCEDRGAPSSSAPPPTTAMTARVWERGQGRGRPGRPLPRGAGQACTAADHPRTVRAASLAGVPARCKAHRQGRVARVGAERGGGGGERALGSGAPPARRTSALGGTFGGRALVGPRPTGVHCQQPVPPPPPPIAALAGGVW